MIFSQDRDVLRKMYRDAWRKKKRAEVLAPLELQIATVVEEHPEYQAYVQDGDLADDFSADHGETNPYLHMGMHLAIREQVSVNRPIGVRQAFERLAARNGDALAAEHMMMEALGVTLWEAQRNNRPADEQAYLERLNRLM